MVTPIAPDDLIGGKLAELAAKIADEAMLGEVGLSDRIDAFKVLTTYYVNTAKIGAPRDAEPEEGVPDFASLQQRISSAANRT